jgi:hypothetical protein
MVFLLKRLHGGVAGVLTAADIEDPRDRSRIRRPSRYGAMTVRMPPTSIRQLRRLFYALTGGLGLPPLVASVEQKLLEAARGRPGCAWIRRRRCAIAPSISSVLRDRRLLIRLIRDSRPQKAGQRRPD